MPTGSPGGRTRTLLISGRGGEAAAGPGWQNTQVLRRSLPMAVLSVALLRAVAAMLFPAVRQGGWPDVALAALSAAAAVTLLVLGPRESPRLWAAGAVAVFWLASTLSAVAANQPVPAATMAMAGVAVVLILGPPESPGPIRLALLAGVAVVTASLVYGGLSAAGVVEGAFQGQELYSRAVLGVLNLRGITLHPNTLGPIAAVTLVLALSTALVTRRGVLWLFAGLAVVALLWSQSRGSLASAALAVAALFVVRRWDRARPFVVGAALALTVIPVMVGSCGESRSSRCGCSPGGPSPGIRQRSCSRSSLSWDTVRRRFSRAFWLERAVAGQWQPLHAHSEVLEVAAEAGVVGLIGLCALTVVAVVAILTRQSPNAAMLVAIFVVMCGQAVVEVPLGLTYFPISYLLPCMGVAAFAYRGDLARIIPARGTGTAPAAGGAVSTEHPAGDRSTSGTSG